MQNMIGCVNGAHPVMQQAELSADRLWHKFSPRSKELSQLQGSLIIA